MWTIKLEYILLDPETRRPIEGLDVQWVFEYQDGTVVDTSEMAKLVKSMPIEAGAVLRLQGIYSTASGIFAKCVATNARRGLDTKPEADDGPLDPNEVVNSPSVVFAVKSTKPEVEDEKARLKPEICAFQEIYIIYSRNYQ